MKKHFFIATIIFASIASSCNDAVKNSVQQAQTVVDCNNIVFSKNEVKQSFPLDSMSENSPSLNIEISLYTATDAPAEIVENANRCIVYAVFGYEDLTPQQAIDSIVETLKSEYYELRSAYINEKIADADAPWFNAYYLLNSTVEKGRSGTFCYTADYEIYNGGAHPNNVVSIVNINPSTGKEITVADVFKENSDSLLCRKLVDRLALQKGTKGLKGLQELGYLTFSDIYVTNNFMLGKDSIEFLYNNYEIAPRALGKSCIKFSYDELSDILK